MTDILRNVFRPSLAGLGFLLLFATAGNSQPGDAAPKFDRADVHVSPPNTMPEMRARWTRGRYELRNATMADLIRTAWNVDADKVVGGPDWLEIDHFDVIATAPPGATPQTLRLMLRDLLSNRFHLVAHNDTRGLPAFALTAGAKPLLQPADGSEKSACEFRKSAKSVPQRGPSEPVVLECRNVTMAALANTLPGIREASGYLFNYPVVDRSGLKGAWNFNLEWTPRMARLFRPAAGEPISLFEAFEKPLGLKLVLIEMSFPVVVVDSVHEKPTANLQELTEKLPDRLEFEVAGIKPEPDYQRGSSVSVELGGSVRIDMTLKGLIQEAWEDFARSDRIVGATAAMDTTPFAVIAKAPVPDDAVAGWNGPVWNGLDIDTMRKMLRTLLQDRFQLETHYEDRPVNGYELIAAKPKLHRADPANRAGCKEGPGADRKDPRLTNPVASRLVTCRNMTLTQFAAQLNNELFGFPPVVDSTGIAGRYDFTINFSPASALQNGPPPGAGGDAGAAEPNGAISLAEALSGQLGLKLQTRKVMAPVLVIDHVNTTPTGN